MKLEKERMCVEMARTSVNSAQALEYDLKLKETQIAQLESKLTKSEVSGLSASSHEYCEKE
jgi:hypothetical protein